MQSDRIRRLLNSQKTPCHSAGGGDRIGQLDAKRQTDMKEHANQPCSSRESGCPEAGGAREPAGKYAEEAGTGGKSVAFLEKVFLDRRERTSALRGVELFNLRLVRELGELGIGVTLFADPSWAETVARETAGVSGVSGSDQRLLLQREY